MEVAALPVMGSRSKVPKNCTGVHGRIKRARIGSGGRQCARAALASWDVLWVIPKQCFMGQD